MEIGVFNGGSLKIWKNYFGPDSRIIGIDINPECKRFTDEGIEIFKKQLKYILPLINTNN